MSTATLVVENTSRGGANGPLTGTSDRMSVGQGDVIEIALSTSIFLKAIVDRRAGAVRFARADEKIIRAPKIVRKILTVDALLSVPGERHDLLKRAQEAFLESHNLPDGHASWLSYAARVTCEERNAVWLAELTKAREAEAALQAEIGRAQEQKLAQAEADAAAAREELQKVQSTKIKPTYEKLAEDLEQAKLQVETFERAGVEASKLERAQKKLERAQKALDDHARDEQGVRVRALLESRMRDYDSAPPKAVDRARLHVLAAQAALASDDFEGVLKHAEQIRAALAQIEWTTETRPMQYGDSVSHGPGAQHAQGAPNY